MFEQEFQLTSLMDLASIDTSDLNAQTTRLARNGIYLVEIDAVKFVEQPSTDPAEQSSYRLNINSTIMAYMPLDPNVESVDLTGRALNEGYFLYGKELRTAIQLLMGRYKNAGFRCKGVMGGVEGSAPGWIEEAIGKRVLIRVSSYTPANGQERSRYDWLSPKQVEKQNLPGITWEVMARDYLDETGKVVDLAA